MTALPLYRCATVLAAPALNHLLRRRLEQGKEDPARIDERRGAPSRPRPDGALIWLHAASVGEAQSALSLIAKLLETAPHASVMMTTGTVSSARYLETRLPDRSFHQFIPLDHPAWVARFLDHWKPDLALWLESELWPNLLTATRARGIPAALINARLSPRSYASWQRFAGTANALLGCFDLCLAQSGQQEDWLKRLGAQKVACVGNLKFSAAPLAADDEELAAVRRALGDRPVWLAASTHEGEEILAADVHLRLRDAHPGLLTIIAPRHPARADGILEALRTRDLRIKRRSLGQEIAPDDDMYLADTMGELGLFYRLAPLAMIGGSFGDVGGHNLMEPAQLGCAILHGPDMRKTQAVADEMTAAGGAVECADADALTEAVDRLLRDAAARTALADAAKAIADAHRGVVDRVCERLVPYLAKLPRNAAS